MKNNPIVEEVRKARQELFVKCNQILKEYLDLLKEEEKQDSDRIVSFEALEKKTT